MDLEQSIEIVQALSQGIDPLSGELLPPTSVYERPETIRALHMLLTHVRTPARARRTTAQKQADNLARGLPRNAGLPWMENTRNELRQAFTDGGEIAELAQRFERTRGAILAELQRQELIAPDDAHAFRPANRLDPPSAPSNR